MTPPDQPVPPKAKGLLLDMDGVIRHWTGNGRRAAEAHVGLPEGALRSIAYTGVYDLAQHGLATSTEWITHVTAALTSQYGERGTRAAALWIEDRGRLDAEMVILLTAARDQGLKIGLLTNSTDLIHADLDQHGITHLFDAIVSSAHAGACKPAPAAYQYAARQLGLAPEEIIFTDDTLTNVEAARRIGMLALLFTDLTTYCADLTVLGIRLPRTALAPLEDEDSERRGVMLAGVARVPERGPRAADRVDGYRLIEIEGDPSPVMLANALATTSEVSRTVALPAGGVAAVTTCGRWQEIRPAPTAAAPIVEGDDAEYLPAWTAVGRAVIAARGDLPAACLALTHLALAHHNGDIPAVRAAADRARGHLTDLLMAFATRDPARRGDGPALASYLAPAIREQLEVSRHLDIPALLNALVTLLRWSRHLLVTVTGTDPDWPYAYLEGTLTRACGRPVTLEPAAPYPAAVYDQALADAYDQSRPLPRDMTDALAAWASDALKDADVIEIGAGTGRLARLLSAGTRSYLAIDSSPGMLTHLTATARATSLRAVLADALALPAPDHSTDIVLEHEVLLFSADPERAAEQALRVLRPGGTLIRILTHDTYPDALPDPVALVHRAYRNAATGAGAHIILSGKGTDALLTHRLAARGLTTTTDTLASWTETPSVTDTLTALEQRAFPFTRPVTGPAHRAGLAAARLRALAVACDEALTRHRTLTLLITRLPAGHHA